jgi:hypothetical protein
MKHKVLLAAVVVAVAALFAMPAFALSDGWIYFDDTKGDFGVTDCVEADMWYDLGFTADTDDDGLGNDWFAVVQVDAYGRPLDVDYWVATVGFSYIGTDYTDMGIIWYEVAARPVTVAMFDIPYPYGNGGGPSENTLKAANWVLANGTFIDEAVQDPGLFSADCAADVPLMDPFSFRYVPPAVMLGWPEDGRLNEHPGAPIAIYAVDDGVFEVWGIDVNTGMGMLAFTADTTGVVAGAAPFIGAEGTNPFSFQPITMYVLPSGEFQINTYYGFGKPYIVTWPMDSTEPGDLYVQDW